MKKITILLFLITVSIGYAQELVANGDFETGDTTGWIGNAANVVLENGNNYNSANVANAGNPWDANLSQVLDVTSGTTYLLTFDAWSDVNRTMLAGIGLNEGPWTAVTETVSLTATSQSYSYTLVGPASSANSRVLFDMGADAGFVGIDNVSLTIVAANCTDGIKNGNETGIDCGGPDCTACPPTCTDGIMNGNETGVDCGGPDCDACVPDAENPTTVDTEVILSLFNDIPGYTNTYSAEGEFGVRNLVNLGAENDETIKMDFSIDSWGQYNNTTVDISAAGFLNFSYYAPNLAPGANGHEVFFMINSGSGEKFYTLKTDGTGDGVLLFDSWQTLSIPLSSFAGFDPNTFLVWKLGTPSTAFTKEVYFDNIYFSVNEVALSTPEFTANEFSVFPNPTKNSWNVKSTKKVNTVEVFNVLGKQVLFLIPNNKDFSINSTSLNSGLYFARMNSNNGTETIKLVRK